MDPGRKGVIALALLKYIVGQEGLRLNSTFRRKLGHVAKATGFSMSELGAFSEVFIEELVAEHVKPKAQR